MDELSYVAALAQEVIKMTNSRVQAILAWADEIETTIGSCKGVARHQHNQAAVATSEIVLELNRIEETQDNAFPHFQTTVLNKDDVYTPQYFYRPDFEKRTITVDVAIVDMSCMVKNMQWKFDPITVPMREKTE
jgi:hypothetical protein